ncbi:MAG: transcriptional regulator [Rhodospirillaceae bacterium]|nr:transcriptional regulator [Rhodospirillaceae bacterium]|tara:strand:+ start:4436 stop:5527 length:1092 start_codon:yes stop_codon:yes gene_type:complete
MKSYWKITFFLGQSTIIGLAIAFLVVLFNPDLVNLNAPNSSLQGNYSNAVAASADSVVSLRTRGRYTTGSVGQGLGSGVIISQDGHLITNYHVIRGADRVLVQLADGRSAEPEIIGIDPETDLALLKINLPELPSIKLGRSDTLDIGQVVLAIGNPYGLSQTVTLGIISATGRGLGLTNFENFIQTDAAINIGNSGGALVNTRGELIGINTARFTAVDEGAPDGIGFAIPVNLVRGVITELVEHGRVIRGWLGVDSQNLPLLQAESLGIDGSAIELLSVSSPAISAGLLPGDIITHINDNRILNHNQAINLVAGMGPGQIIQIQGIRRGSGAFETHAILEERPSAARWRRATWRLFREGSLTW